MRGLRNELESSRREYLLSQEKGVKNNGNGTALIQKSSFSKGDQKEKVKKVVEWANFKNARSQGK